MILPLDASAFYMMLYLFIIMIISSGIIAGAIIFAGGFQRLMMFE